MIISTLNEAKEMYNLILKSMNYKYDTVAGHVGVSPSSSVTWFKLVEVKGELD